MEDTFSSSDGFDSKNDGIIPDLFPPLAFDSLPMGAQNQQHSGSDSPNDDYLWHESSLAMNETRSTVEPSCGVGSSSHVPADAPTDSSVFNISWGGDDKPPAKLHLDEDTEIVSRKPLPKPRGIRRLPEPEPAEDGTLDEDTLRRRRNTHAARRSRLKKFLKVEYLENRVNQLQTENAKLVLSNALLESEKRGWLAKEAEYKKRIKYLEESKALSPES